MSNPFLGLFGLNNLETDEDPDAWNNVVLRTMPNGSAQIYALTSLMKKRKLANTTFNWWVKGFRDQLATITGIYTDAALSSAYTTGATKGTQIFVKGSAAHVSHFRPRHMVLLTNDTDPTYQHIGKVTDRHINGANSYVSVIMLQAESVGGYLAYSADKTNRMLVIGSVNPQGSERPEALHYPPVKYTNYTQIFRDAVAITRTTQQTELRTRNRYLESKADCLFDHAVGIEKGLLFSVGQEGTGDNNQPETTTDGLLNFVRTNESGNFDYYPTNATYTSKTWLNGGEDFLEDKLETLFRWTDSVVCFGGSGAIKGLNRLVRYVGNYQIEANTEKYGINVQYWITPYGTIYVKNHPLFSAVSTMRNMMVLMNPKDLAWCTIQPTHYAKDDAFMKGGGDGLDGIREGYLTEAGMQFGDPKHIMVLGGIGLDGESV